MTGYVSNLENLAENNTNFRQVVFTASHCQLVLMSLLAGEDIGMEVHPDVDQFFRIEVGEGKVIMNGAETTFSAGYGIVVPAGTEHNVINTGVGPLKLYTIYSPANHPEGTIHATKADAVAAHHE